MGCSHLMLLPLRQPRQTIQAGLRPASLAALTAWEMRRQSRERRPEFVRIPATVSGSDARIRSNRRAKTACRRRSGRALLAHGNRSFPRAFGPLHLRYGNRSFSRL